MSLPSWNAKYISCNNNREVMLCQQVLRMCRGEGSEFTFNGHDWGDANDKELCIETSYRAKPKKELVVPWEWFNDECVSLCVNEAKVISLTDCNGNLIYMTGFKLDLEGIELPVTVHRPQR